MRLLIFLRVCVFDEIGLDVVKILEAQEFYDFIFFKILKFYETKVILKKTRAWKANQVIIKLRLVRTLQKHGCAK